MLSSRRTASRLRSSIEEGIFPHMLLVLFVRVELRRTVAPDVADLTLDGVVEVRDSTDLMDVFRIRVWVRFTRHIFVLT